MVNTMSPARRRSIAVLNPSQPSRKKRRASSLLPSEKRRHLAPRKSILKAALLNDGDEEEAPTPASSAGPRKSMGHRVSFASHAHVRLFEKPENTNSTESPSSPAASSPPHFEPAPSSVVNDENAYPGAAPQGNRRKSAMRRRRSSTARPVLAENGEGEEDMDIDDTATESGGFLGSDDIVNESFEDEDEAMDITLALGPVGQGRRSSIGPTKPRRRSTAAFFVYQDDPDEENTTEIPLPTPPIPPAPAAAVTSGDESFLSQDMSVTEDHGDITGFTDQSHVEFNVPMDQPLNPPKPPSAALLELAAMTHSGGLVPDSDHDEPNMHLHPVLNGTLPEEEDTNMSLDDAITRLSNIRRQSVGALSTGSNDMEVTSAFPGGQASRAGEEGDSFSSMDDSFERGGDQTVNVTTLMRRASSMGGQLARELGLDGASGAPRESVTEMSMDVTSALNGDEDFPLSATGRTSRSRTTLGATSSAVGRDMTAMDFTSVAGQRAEDFTEDLDPALLSPLREEQTAVPYSQMPDTTSGSASSAQMPPSVFSRPNVFSAPARASATSSPVEGPGPSTNNGKLPEPSRPGTSSTRSVFSRSVSANPAANTLGKGTPSEPAQPRSAPASPVKKTALDRRLPVGPVNELRPVPDEALSALTSTGANMPGEFLSQPSSSQIGLDGDESMLGTNDARPIFGASKRPASRTSGVGANKRISLDAGPSTRRRNSSIGASGAPSPRAPKSKKDIAGRGRASIASSEVGAEMGEEEASLYPNLDELRAEMAEPASPAPQRPIAAEPSSPSPIEPAVARAQRRQSMVNVAARRQSLRPGAAARPSTAGRPRFSLLAHSTANPQPRRSARAGDASVDVDDPFEEVEELSPISIDQFFEMTGIKFMDDITVPRRSSIHPSQLRRRRSSTSRVAAPVDPVTALVDDFIAMSIHVPQLQVYGAAARTLQAWIDDSKAHYAQANEDAKKLPPGLFEEYQAIDDEGKADLLAQLRTIKTNSRELTRKHWYSTKLEWTMQLLKSTEDALAGLEQDSQTFADLQKQFDAVLPSAEEDSSKLQRELELEQGEVDEIEGCDQGYLTSLKDEISEQTTILETFKRDLEKDREEISTWETKQRELQLQEQESSAAIDEATRVLELQKGTGIAERAKIEAELELIEWLNGWKAVKMQPNLLELLYDSRFRVIIPQQHYKPVPAKITVELDTHAPPARKHEWFPGMEPLFLRTAKQRAILSQAQLKKNSSIARMFASYWTSTKALRRDLEDLVMPYAHDFQVSPPQEDSFTLTLPLLFHSRKARANVRFTFHADTFATWPRSLSTVETDVTVSYGDIEGHQIRQCIEERLRTVDLQSCRNHLRDAVDAARALYL